MSAAGAAPRKLGPFTSIYECIGLEADTYQQLLYTILGARSVTRFHTVDMLKERTIGAHQHDVAWFCYWLCEGTPRMELIMAALGHDSPEQLWGDMPGPVKWQLGLEGTFNELEQRTLHDNHSWFPLTENEQWVLNIADRMAGMMECIAERRLGNQNVMAPYHRWQEYVRKQLPKEPLPHHALVEPIMAAIHRHWEESIGR